MNEALTVHARRAVPRYTSYPTAPNFRSDFPPATYRGWLAGLDPAETISLYVHVPFCRQLCWYCGCNMKLAVRAEPIAAYVESLLSEMDLVAGALPARPQVAHLHWGGGTPTSLEPSQLRRAMARLRDRFEILPDAVLAIESDPRTLTDAMVAEIGESGFTRASFGVQEFDPQVQAAINRIQPADVVAAAVSRLRGAGVSSIGFDLIYGLPHQTVATLLRTVALVAEMRPGRVALFGYAHVPWMAKGQRMIPSSALPGPDARAELFARASAALVAAGYVAIGLDHFALPEDDLAVAAREGRLHRNFQGYTTDAARTLIGLGTSAIGRTPRGYVQNIVEPGAWARAIAAGRLPIAKGLELRGEDRLRAQVIERIMCDGAVDLDAVGMAFGAPARWWEAERDALDRLAMDGLLDRRGGVVVLTDDGKPLSRVCAAVFDRYLEPNASRYSVAV
jgi:oxygen-independent coproporphyrinogen-3 oxidase